MGHLRFYETFHKGQCDRVAACLVGPGVDHWVDQWLTGPVRHPWVVSCEVEVEKRDFKMEVSRVVTITFVFKYSSPY